MNDDVKKNITALFDLLASQYDNPAQRFFPFVGDRLIEHLSPGPGHKILDIATGTGAVALPAAQAILPTGRVQAIDLSEKMLDTAAANMQRSGLANVDFHNMDAETLQFKPNYFDYATCSFGIFFLDDMQSALQEWLRVLKHEGRLMFTSFGRNAFEPLARQFKQDMEGFGVPVPEVHWKRLCEESQCRQLLESAGYEAIQTTTEQMGYHLNDSRDWWELIYSTGYRAFIEQLSAIEQHEFRQKHLKAIEHNMTDKGIWLDVEVIFASGRKPASPA